MNKSIWYSSDHALLYACSSCLYVSVTNPRIWDSISSPKKYFYRQVSNSSTLEDLMIARARHMSCRWPTENDVPLSFTCMSSPPADSTSAFIWHFSRASQIFQSLALPYGSRFSLTFKDKKRKFRVACMQKMGVFFFLQGCIRIHRC